MDLPFSYKFKYFQSSTAAVVKLRWLKLLLLMTAAL